VLLALTYSRGGWVATLAGFLVLAISYSRLNHIPDRRHVCKTMTLACLILVGAICLVPHGVRRVENIANWEDRSILNRLEVWRGAMVLTARQPWTGVGWGEFGTEFRAWVQPLEMPTRYRTAIHNYLSISSERGLPALGLFLVGLLAPLFAAWLVVRNDTSVIGDGVRGGLAGSAVWIVSGFFNNGLDSVEASLAMGILWGDVGSI
jgi:O-antigen ligase